MKEKEKIVRNPNEITIRELSDYVLETLQEQVNRNGRKGKSQNNENDELK